MIQFETGGILLQEASELPQVPKVIPRLYADFETTSGHPSKMSTNPWFNCKAIGAAVSFAEDDDAPVWFVPKHLLVTGWWRDVIRATKVWCNQNVKYDAHVSANDLSVVPFCEFDCTLNSAKLVDSDRVYRGGYGLDVLSEQWLGWNIDEYGWRMLPYLQNSKDYGDVPLDILAEYACVDVIVNKKLAWYIRREMPEESGDVWATERAITELLFRMEQRGVLVDPLEVQKTRLRVLHRMIQIDEKLQQITGRPFRPHVNADCYDVFVNQYGLPVLEWTDPEDDEDGSPGTPGPSFNKNALAKYLAYPGAPTELVELTVEYRQLNTFDSLFLSQWEHMHINGVMHATYNQSVRTGRMSCSEPNLQQLNVLAKLLIIPPPGYAIVCSDASQIEYRFIGHYIGNERIIQAYNENPWIDFHQWVADMIPTKRKPAKTLNFAMGYGQGKKSTVAALKINKEFVGDVIADIDKRGIRASDRSAAIDQATTARATEVYNKYHNMMPELKPTSRYAARICAQRGYVRNHYGRRRHLPPEKSHVAFNSLNQSSAGDLVKERMVALDREVPELIQIAQVHDEVVGLCPLELVERDDEFLKRVVSVLNAPARPLRVPIRWAIGWSKNSWAEAKSDERQKEFF